MHKARSLLLRRLSGSSRDFESNDSDSVPVGLATKAPNGTIVPRILDQGRDRINLDSLSDFDRHDLFNETHAVGPPGSGI